MCDEGQTLDYESPALTAELQAHFHMQTSTAKKGLSPIFMFARSA
jgi:hypothetical protein